MKAFIPLAIACTIATSAGAVLAQDAAKMIYPFSIKDGETLVLRRVTSTTNNCGPLFEKIEDIDVMEGAQQLTFSFEEQMMHTSTVTRDCPDDVPGAAIMITAKDVTTRIEVEVVLRVRMQTKNGPWQNTLKERPGVPAAAPASDVLRVAREPRR